VLATGAAIEVTPKGRGRRPSRRAATDEPAFARAWAAGQRLSLEDAVREALVDD
jgi:hypothetical protein